ncbi:TIGR04002 family protein [Clostridium sp.]|uniref:TIGR04002 family protein n=1 Tax=Clostridium sp. TaxID=1506 RepID=UPI003F2E1257
MDNSIKVRKIVLTALLAAMICLTTAFIFHIPTGVNGGYIHVGDAFIYLAACILPAPYAMIAASLGAGLADVLSGAMIWVIPTMIIKPLLVLPFTKGGQKLINKRNIYAVIIAGVTGIVGYYIADGIILGNFIAPLATLAMGVIQPIGSGIIFILVSLAFDKINLIDRLPVQSK